MAMYYKRIVFLVPLLLCCFPREAVLLKIPTPGDVFGVVESPLSKVVSNDEMERNEAECLPALPGAMATCKYYYDVRVMNGRMMPELMDAAGGPNSYITLIGTKGSTGKVSLLGTLRFFVNGMESGTYEELTIETENDLGEVQVVVLGIDGTLLSSDDLVWFVEFTEVTDLTKQSQSVQFPVYHWIKTDEYVTSVANTATLSDAEGNEILLQERATQLEVRKQLYQWQYFPEVGLPSGIDDTVSELPLDEEFSRVNDIDFTLDSIQLTAAGMLANIITIDDLHDYIDIVKLVDRDAVLLVEQASRWTSDVEFGREILNGVNPVVIKRCTSLPANLPVTNEMVQPLLTRGLTLEQEMEAGHIYIGDLNIMDGLPTKDGHYAAAPLCLLYAKSSKQLVPIAIQLKQGLREEERGQPNPIFLPTDPYLDWLMAKIYYQSAHAQLHQLSTHYQSCHAAMEAYAMATMRNLPDAHPIYKMLRPHFRYTMAINSRARATLINDGGIIDMAFSLGTEGKVELLKRATTLYSVDWTNIKESVKVRGVDDPDLLPGYYYRDDGLKIFGAIEDFVRDIVNTFYASDEEVTSDPELQAWVKDIYTNGFPGYYGGEQGHGFPSEITTKEKLIERCTVIIFTGSAQHASVNFGQFEIFGYVPNAPSDIRQPLITEKGVATHEYVVDSLPDVETAAQSVGIVYSLAQYSPDEVLLGNYPYQRFTEAEVLSSIDKFQERLAEISAEINARNEGLDFPYIYMLPENIPNSITI